MTAPDVPQPSMSEPEAADFLRLSKWTLARWRAAGGGPRFVKAGRRVTYDVADLIAWRNSRKRNSIADDGQAQSEAA